MKLSNPRLKVSSETHMFNQKDFPATPPVSLKVTFVDDQIVDFKQDKVWGVNADEIVGDICRVCSEIEYQYEERGETVE